MSYPSVCDRLVIVLGPSWRSNFVDVLIRFARCLLGCPRYGVYDDASCSDQRFVYDRPRSSLLL